MRSTREVRCPKCGRLLFKIIDEEEIEILCSKGCRPALRYKLPQRNLTVYKEAGKIILR